MNELFAINTDGNEPTVSARDLHKALGIRKRFSEWFEKNSQGFIENEDFSNPYLKVRVQIEGGREVQREVEDFDLSVDMAKHICLMSRTDKGRECRQRLIDLEKSMEYARTGNGQSLKDGRKDHRQPERQVQIPWRTSGRATKANRGNDTKSELC